MTNKKTSTAMICAAISALSWAGSAHAATDTDTFQVTATVVASCDVDAADLGFGNYDPVSATPQDATGSMVVRCTNGTGYTIAMNAGAGSGATVASRHMTSGGNALTYSLYRDAARNTVWGENTGVNTVAGTGNGAAQNLTIYARIPAQQTAPAGAYTDTVTVTLTY